MLSALPTPSAEDVASALIDHVHPPTALRIYAHGMTPQEITELIIAALEPSLPEDERLVMLAKVQAECAKRAMSDKRMEGMLRKSPAPPRERDLWPKLRA